MEDIKKIIVTRMPKKKIMVYNPTNYPMIGAGVQGAVFKLSEDKCVKIYSDELHMKMEREAYKRTQNSKIIPRMYGAGSNYMVMEYVKGITLEQYLSEHRKLDKDIVQRLVEMFKEMKRLKFTRYDLAPRHIILTDDKSIKVIDHVNSFKNKQQEPKRLFKLMDRYGILSEFLKQVESIDKDFYKEWTVRSKKQ